MCDTCFFFLPDDGPARLFEWSDGPLVRAMREGGAFLADEVSLADDSVLERLNSALEPERTLVLAEKGGEGRKEADGHVHTISAAAPFRIMATMNPGGDFGKKEVRGVNRGTPAARELQKGLLLGFEVTGLASDSLKWP